MRYSTLLGKWKRSVRRRIRRKALVFASVFLLIAAGAMYVLFGADDQVVPAVTSDGPNDQQANVADDDEAWQTRIGSNTYVGLSPDGHLSLFDGLPEEQNIIRTFFQLNVEYLESSLPHETVRQLHNGIRVADMEEYNSVLSTFSPYAIDVTSRVAEDVDH